jgi:hypothetical protein
MLIITSVACTVSGITAAGYFVEKELGKYLFFIEKNGVNTNYYKKINICLGLPADIKIIDRASKVKVDMFAAKLVVKRFITSHNDTK